MSLTRCERAKLHIFSILNESFVPRHPFISTLHIVIHPLRTHDGDEEGLLLRGEALAGDHERLKEVVPLGLAVCFEQERQGGVVHDALVASLEELLGAVEAGEEHGVGLGALADHDLADVLGL